MQLTAPAHFNSHSTIISNLSQILSVGANKQNINHNTIVGLEVMKNETAGAANGICTFSRSPRILCILQTLRSLVPGSCSNARQCDNSPPKMYEVDTEIPILMCYLLKDKTVVITPVSIYPLSFRPNGIPLNASFSIMYSSKDRRRRCYLFFLLFLVAFPKR